MICGTELGFQGKIVHVSRDLKLVYIYAIRIVSEHVFPKRVLKEYVPFLCVHAVYTSRLFLIVNINNYF